jgi:hypothetical protein
MGGVYDISAHHPSINDAVKLVKQGNSQSFNILYLLFNILVAKRSGKELGIEISRSCIHLVPCSNSGSWCPTV